MKSAVSIVAEIVLWVIAIYFTIYCVKNYIDGSNIYYTCFLHLLLIFLTVLLYPPE